VDNILLKLQKLIAHRDSAEKIGSLKEAEAFAELIQKLLLKHKLTISDVDAHKEEEAGVSSGLDVDPRRFGMKDKDDMIHWLFKLAATIAKVNDCQLMVTSRTVKTNKAEKKATGKDYKYESTNRFIFVGIQTDRMVAEEFYVYMAKLVWELAGKAGDSMKEDFRTEILRQLGKCAPGHLSAKLHDFRHSYCKGFVDAVSERLVEAYDLAKREAAVQERGLMVIDRRALMVKDYMKQISTVQTDTQFYKAGKQSVGYGMGLMQGKKVALTSKTVETRK